VMYLQCIVEAGNTLCCLVEFGVRQIILGLEN
jgi:hypothetical protein